MAARIVPRAILSLRRRAGLTLKRASFSGEGVWRTHAPAATSARLAACAAAPAWLRGAGFRGPHHEHACHAVDEQRQHEQDERGGEQRRAVQALGLAELVRDRRRERVALPEQVPAELGRVADQDRHGDRLADRAAEAEHRPADDARAAVGQHGDSDHLPAGRPEAERRLLVVERHRGHHLAAERRDDRQDHDREHQAGDEVVGNRGHAAADERDEGQAIGHPLLGRLELRGQEEDAPQPVHDRGHRGEQLDQHGDRPAHAPWGELGHVDGGRNRHRDADHQRQHGGDHRADEQRQRAELFGVDVPVVVEREAEHAELGERRFRLPDEAEEEVDDQRQDQAGQDGQAVLQGTVRKTRQR